MIGIEALKVTGNAHSLYYDGTVYETGMNNRLALLGDRVLSLALCEIWFHTDHSNGGYAHMSSQTVSRAALAVTGQKLGLHLSILAAGSKIMTSDHIAETFEAVMAAVYVDSGYSMKVVKDVIRTLKMDDHFYLKTPEELKFSDIAKEPVNQKSHTSSCEQGTIVTGEQNGPVGWKETDAKDANLPLTQQQQIKQGLTRWAYLAPKNVNLNATHRRSIKVLESWIAQRYLGEKSAMALRALQKYARLVSQGNRPDPMSVFHGIERAEKLGHLAESEVSSSESHEPRLEEAKEKSVNFGASEKDEAFPGFRRLIPVKESDDAEEPRHKQQTLWRHARLPEQGQNRKPLNTLSEVQNVVARSQVVESGKGESESPEQGLREAEEKRVNTEAVERSLRVFSEPKVSSFKSTVKHANGKVEVGAEMNRNDVNVVQESQHTVAKQEKAEEVYTVESTPHKRPSKRYSSLKSTATEPSVEELEQTTVASHMDAWASLDSEANTKSLVEFAPDRPFLESDMDRFFGGLLYNDYEAVDAATQNRVMRTENKINSGPRTTKELLSVANGIQAGLVRRTLLVSRQTHLIRLRIRMAASSSTTAQVLPVAEKHISAPERRTMRIVFQAVVSTAMKDGLRFGSPAWRTFVRNSLERGEKDPKAAQKHLWMANIQKEIELFGEENLPHHKPSAVQETASDISTGLFIEAKGQPESPTTELPERTSKGGDQAVTAQSSEVPKILNEAEKALRRTTGMLRRFQAFLGSKQRLHNKSVHLKRVNNAVVSPGAPAAPPATVPSTRNRRYRFATMDAIRLPRNHSAKTDVGIKRSRVPPRLNIIGNMSKDKTNEDEKRESLAINDAIKRKHRRQRQLLQKSLRKNQEPLAPTTKLLTYSHQVMRV